MKTPKANNPFADYQKKRKRETLLKIEAAIKTIQTTKGNISYSNIANLAKMTVTGVKKNKEAVYLIEQARASCKGTELLTTSVNFGVMPNTLSEAISMIRLQKADIRELKKTISIYEKTFKRYNIDKSENGKYSFEPIQRKEQDLIDLHLRILKTILDDKVYKLTSKGIIDPLNKIIVSKNIIEACGILDEFNVS
jgi:hypothetical protein